MVYPLFLAAIGFFAAGFGFLNAGSDSRFLILGAMGALLFIVANLTLCPRCRLNIARRPTKYRHDLMPIPHHCFRCGRTRIGVWPLQFLFKPEPWDGKYHDEGGGPQQRGAWPNFYN